MMPQPRIRPLVALTLGAGLLAGTAAHAEPRTFELDPEHLSIGFLVEHVGYQQQLGMFLEAEGEFVYDEATRTLHSGEVRVQSESVFTNHEERDGHLRSDDFLDSESHPVIRFEAGELDLGDDNTGTLEGDLTLLGTTRPVTLDVTLNKTGRYPFGDKAYVLGGSARGVIQRSEFGMTYGVEGDLVGDRVELILEFEAVRQPR